MKRAALPIVALLIFSLTLPVGAQVAVYDAANISANVATWINRILSYIKQIADYLKQVQQYITMVEDLWVQYEHYYMMIRNLENWETWVLAYLGNYFGRLIDIAQRDDALSTAIPVDDLHLKFLEKFPRIAELGDMGLEWLETGNRIQNRNQSVMDTLRGTLLRMATVKNSTRPAVAQDLPAIADKAKTADGAVQATKVNSMYLHNVAHAIHTTNVINEGMAGAMAVYYNNELYEKSMAYERERSYWTSVDFGALDTGEYISVVH